MNIGIPGFSAAAFAVVLCFSPVAASSQAKPPESTSKVKKVMLYNKIGGWEITYGIAAVKATFEKLAAAKGFELVQLESESPITLEYLKQFQAIVWNNNTNGAASVPSASARQAILDYVDQGGGWVLIHGAGNHSNTWPGLTEAMGTTFARHAMVGRSDVVLDKDGLAHKELKWMMAGFPVEFELSDLWYSFTNTVRPLPGVTVVATAREAKETIYTHVLPTQDGSKDQVYIWAREIGRGRLLYNAIGAGYEKLMEQQDSIVPRLYWQNLRYAAGDFQNGCANPLSAHYDPAARVHVEAMCADMLPKVNLKDTTISVRDSLRFAPQKFGMCLFSYQSRYEVVAENSADSLPRHLIRLTSRLVPECLTAAGFSGPVVVLKDLPPGIHRLAFTDSSDFRLAIPDTVRIRVVEAGSLSIRPARAGRMPGRTTVAPPRSVDGRLRQGRPETRGATPVFRR